MFARHLGTAALAATFVVSSCDCGDDLIPVVDRGALRGLICADVDGQAAVGMTVTVIDQAGTSYTAVTGVGGSFLIEGILAGTATVVISDGGGEREGTTVVSKDVITPFNDLACHEPLVPPPVFGTIDGCICDDAVGQWIVGGNVYVSLPSGDIAATVTDSEGCFSLGGLPSGDFVLSVDKGIFTETHDVTVVVEQTTSLPPVVSCEPPVVPENAGAVAGRVCAPDGETWLSGAEVFVVLENGTRVAAVTDGNGAYTLSGVPVGRHTVHVVKGSFSSEFQADVSANTTTEIPEAECTISPVGLRVAVVAGDYDDVAQVLTSIGIEQANMEVFQSSFLNDNIAWVDELVLDYERLRSFDIVFLNCGAGDRQWVGRSGLFPIAVNQAAIANLRRFVTEGGSVYASDWAYTFVEATWPDFIDFVGNETRDVAKVGAITASTPAAIVDAQMAASLGQTSLNLHYPLAEWAVMQSVSAQTTIYVRGGADLLDGTHLDDVPHTVAFRPGAGRVLFTSFHQEAGINPDMQRILQLLMFEL